MTRASRRRIVASIGTALLALAVNGCGYSLSGRGSFLPAYIRTIGVPMFGNVTNIPDVERRVTERVRSELIGRGRYTVETSRTGVDAVLSGEITSISFVPTGFNQQQQATRYALTLVGRIELRDLKTDKILWQNPSMQFSEQYDATTVSTATDPGAFLRQDANALDRLASEFARAVVSAMLEAF
jgi:hypothetical protein